jgi:hypothetical protein
MRSLTKTEVHYAADWVLGPCNTQFMYEEFNDHCA